MKVLTLLNEKGGVGKTTLSVHIAAGLAMKGYRVVLIDADPQGQSGLLLSQEKRPSLYNLLIRNEEWEDVLKAVPTYIYDPAAPEPDDEMKNVSMRTGAGGELYLVPGHMETRAIGVVNPNPFLLREKLREIAQWADIVVNDTSPTPSQFHTTIYMATDSILFPVHPAYLALDGLANSVLRQEMARQEREALGNGSLTRMGIVPTMFENTKAHDVAMQQLLQEYKRLVWPSVPKRTVWQRAAFVGRSLFRYAPSIPDVVERNEVTEELWGLVNRVELSLQMEDKVNG